MQQVEPQLIEKILEKYAQKNCAYLKQAAVTVSSGALSMENSQLAGEFSVLSPVHIQCGSHFNAVEFFICANQMIYVLSGHFAHQGLLKIQHQSIDFDAFIARRETCYIARVKEVKFASVIDSLEFYGEVTIQRERDRSGKKYIEAKLRFFDNHEGYAEGVMSLVMT